MTDMSNYLENELLDHITGVGAWTAPASIYALLHLGAPGEDGTANVAVNNLKSGAITFSAASAGVAASSVDASWTSVSTTETYSHISLWDNNTAGSGTGNCLFVGALSASVGVTAGDDFTIPSTQLTITFD